jgi:glycosyltransferase involved in cell wall biosynthesis
VAYCPQVSLIVTVHNEEQRIREKIKNTLDLDYPDEKLEIIFASDASTDGTDNIIESYKQLKLVRAPKRKGKEFAQKCAVDQSTGEIMVFTDVATMLDRDGLCQIVANFSDDTVGCVSSEDKFIDSDGRISGEGAYVKYEMFLRNLESRVNTLVGLSGSFFAARRSVCLNWVTDLQSDFNTLLNSVKLGMRGVSDPKSAGYYQNISDEKKEFNRKIRTVLRGISVLMQNLYLLNPFIYGLFSWQLSSHKLCRWFVPFFMIFSFIANAAIMFNSAFLFSLFFLQTIFYSLSIYYYKQVKHAPHEAITPNQNSKLKIKNIFVSFAKLSHYFVSVNASILMAWWKYFRGERSTFWEPSVR